MPVPPHVLKASQAAFDLYEPSVAVLRLVADSLLDEDCGVERDAGRQLLFQNASVAAEVSVSVEGSRLRLRVDVVPADFDQVELRRFHDGQSAGVQDVGADVSNVEPGLTSLILRRSTDGATVRTAWVRI